MRYWIDYLGELISNIRVSTNISKYEIALFKHSGYKRCWSMCRAYLVDEGE
jgi:hypothetical protein